MAETTTTTTTETATDSAPATDASTQQTTGNNTQSAGDNTQSTGDNTQNTDSTSESTGAPDEYADFEVPDGVTVDTELMTAFKAEAKALNLSQDQAGKLAGLGAQMAQKIQAQMLEQHEQQINAWTEATKTDPEIGGEQLAENLSVAKRALDAFGSPELVSLLNETGLGNHPALIKTFLSIGRQIAEDKFVPAGAQVPPKAATIAQQLYPNMNP